MRLVELQKPQGMGQKPGERGRRVGRDPQLLLAPFQNLWTLLVAVVVVVVVGNERASGVCIGWGVFCCRCCGAGPRRNRNETSQTARRGQGVIAWRGQGVIARPRESEGGADQHTNREEKRREEEEARAKRAGKRRKADAQTGADRQGDERQRGRQTGKGRKMGRHQERTEKSRQTECVTVRPGTKQTQSNGRQVSKPTKLHQPTTSSTPRSQALLWFLFVHHERLHFPSGRGEHMHVLGVHTVQVT